MKNLKLIILGAIVLAVGGGLFWWYENSKTFPETDDAYLQANLLTISPQVGGRVTEVMVGENDFVRAGDVLFKLDDAMLSAAVDTAQAQFDQAVQAAGASGSNVSAAEAQLQQADAALREASLNYERNEKLHKLGDVAQAALDQAAASRDQAAAAKQAAEASVAAARDQLGKSGDDNAGVRAALGALTVAQINLEHTVVTAPADGWIANISLRPGQVVAPGQSLFSLVEDGNWWIEGNFKETDLARIRPGQPVSIGIDMYPGTTLTGRIVSIGAGSGAVFSLLPAQNASGNWVKVTQRFPVRISIDAPPSDPARQLRVGASVTTKVDTSNLDAKGS